MEKHPTVLCVQYCNHTNFYNPIVTYDSNGAYTDAAGTFYEMPTYKPIEKLIEKYRYLRNYW